MRPNFAQDAPPTEISVGGFSYPCNTDYRVWLEVLRLMREIRTEADTEEQKQANLDLIAEIQTLVFDGVLADESLPEVMNAVVEFSKGYPAAPYAGGSDDTPVYSFNYDLNAIIIAIRNQSGIDLSYRRTDPFHWWEFLLEFQTLCGDHYILNLMEARGYKGKDRELLRRKRACALPEEYTAEELAAMAEFNAMFEEPDAENKEEDKYAD